MDDTHSDDRPSDDTHRDDARRVTSSRWSPWLRAPVSTGRGYPATDGSEAPVEPR
jgi:hypothetical protein